jgi:hypothetical protein
MPAFTFSVGHEEVPSALNLVCTALQPSGLLIGLQKKKKKHIHITTHIHT